MTAIIIVTDYAPDGDDDADGFRFTATVRGDRKRRRGGTGSTEAEALVWLLKQFPAPERAALQHATIERHEYRQETTR